MATLKGQNFRILTLSGSDYKVVAQATNCTITLTNNTDDASHKDVVGMAAMPTVTSKAWQVQVESLDVTDVATVLATIKSLTPFTLVWDETSTVDNQTGQHATVARTGQAYLSDVTVVNISAGFTELIGIDGKCCNNTFFDKPFGFLSISAVTKKAIHVHAFLPTLKKTLADYSVEVFVIMLIDDRDDLAVAVVKCALLNGSTIRTLNVETCCPPSEIVVCR